MTSPFARRRRTLGALTLALLLPVTASACGGDRVADDDATPSVNAAAAGSPSASPSPSPSPSTSPSASAATADEPTGARPTEAPPRSVDAGTVAAGAPATAQGEGAAEITFERDGAFAVVAHLDCSACSGATVLTGPGRGTPFGESGDALVGDYLMDVFEDSEPQQSLWLVADGKWTLRLESWNDLVPVAGEQSGEGSTVLAFSDTASAMNVSFEPAGPDDRFSGRYFSVSGDPLMFGDTEAFDDSYDVSLPGVLAIMTNGSWTVTPGK